MRLPREIAIVWALLAAMLVAVLVTYSRLPADELYNVSGTGFRAGLSRVVVDLNFPGALVALAVLAVVAGRLRRRALPAAWVAAVLCVVFAVPGVVRQSNLDARWLNAIPAAGVVTVFILSLRADGPESPPHAAAIGSIALGARARRPRVAVDRRGARVLPRRRAGARVAVPDRKARQLPQRAAPCRSSRRPSRSAGIAFVVTALLLSRLRSSQAARAFLALLLAYGVANIANDDWLEQVVERGWSSHAIPSVLGFAANWLWLATFVVGFAVWALWFRQSPSVGGGDP